MPQLNLVNKYLTLTGKGEESSYLSESIIPKMDVIARQEFELAYHNVTGQYVSHYAMVTPQISLTFIQVILLGNFIDR